MLTSAFTVDVEDYYQVTAFDRVVSRKEWGAIPCRVEASTRRMLELLARHNVRATFFVLGWVAERFPGLVRAIDAAGHEIGSHSYWHRLIYQQTPDDFRQDLRQSKQVLEDAIGKEVTLYRAPTFSITHRSDWALDILMEEGFTIDSSIFPVKNHDRYGMPGIRPEIHEIKSKAGCLWEVPMSVARFLGRDIPVAGGGYFRLYPLNLTCRLMRKVLGRGRPVNFYIHPWEIDPDQPRQSGLGATARYRHYVNLQSTQQKLDKLLGTFHFTTLGSLVAEAKARKLAAERRAEPVVPACHVH